MTHSLRSYLFIGILMLASFITVSPVNVSNASIEPVQPAKVLGCIALQPGAVRLGPDKYLSSSGDSVVDAKMRQVALVPSVAYHFIDDTNQLNAYAVDGHTILLGKELLKKIASRNADAIAVIYWHEVRHTSQFSFANMQAGKDLELEADYYAGYTCASNWYYKYEDKGSDADDLLNRNLIDAGTVLFNLGDYAFNDPLHHGTPARRLEKFMAGAACALEILRQTRKGECTSGLNIKKK